MQKRHTYTTQGTLPHRTTHPSSKTTLSRTSHVLTWTEDTRLRDVLNSRRTHAAILPLVDGDDRDYRYDTVRLRCHPEVTVDSNAMTDAHLLREQEHVIAPQTVICFDRDRTIDVHPPEDNDAVPLAWVQYLAHHENTATVDVWATGNQHLRAEAGIPGLRNAITIWETHFEDDIYDVFPRPSPETYKPYRRNGLALVRTLYETAFPDADITFIVVDDEPLDDLEDDGWLYYAPWDFVEAITANTAPVTIPPDAGGFPSISLESADNPHESPKVDDQHPFQTNPTTEETE